jgi:UDP-2,3-diacylglucosamine hydrolase
MTDPNPSDIAETTDTPNAPLPAHTVIVSDVHLNVAKDGAERMEAFTRFLQSWTDAPPERLIILGDLFDFWFEYRHVIFSGYFEVLRAFADLRDLGVAFHFVCGNHDFWAGRFLRDALAFEIHRDPVTLAFGARSALLVHGDGVNPRDVSYRLYKRIARSRWVIRCFRAIHPDWAMRIAQGVSRGSRRAFSPDDPADGPEIAPQRAFAAKCLQDGQADIVMCGHSHYPVHEWIETMWGPRLYLNTGDWVAHRTYAVWDGAEFRLEQFGSAPIDERNVAGEEAGDVSEQDPQDD